MKRRDRKSDDLYHAFHTTCGWCGRKIPPDGGSVCRNGQGSAGYRPHRATRDAVLTIHLVSSNKSVLIAVAGLDSEALCEGYDFVYMTCSEGCPRELKTAFERDIEMGKRSGLR